MNKSEKNTVGINIAESLKKFGKGSRKIIGAGIVGVGLLFGPSGCAEQPPEPPAAAGEPGPGIDQGSQTGSSAVTPETGSSAEVAEVSNGAPANLEVPEIKAGPGVDVNSAEYQTQIDKAMARAKELGAEKIVDLGIYINSDTGRYYYVISIIDVNSYINGSDTPTVAFVHDNKDEVDNTEPGTGNDIFSGPPQTFTDDYGTSLKGWAIGDTIIAINEATNQKELWAAGEDGRLEYIRPYVEN